MTVALFKGGKLTFRLLLQIRKGMPEAEARHEPSSIVELEARQKPCVREGGLVTAVACLLPPGPTVLSSVLQGLLPGPHIRLGRVVARQAPGGF